MPSLLTLLCVLSVFTFTVKCFTDEMLWTSFKKDHNKSYKNLEEDHRFSIFQRNLRKIEEHNNGYKNGTTSYYLKVTQFADLTQDEFIALYLSRRKPAKSSHRKRQALVALKKDDPTANATAPYNIDWRDKNVISEVKNQGNCGGCWAFSVTGALEAHTSIKHNRNILLSEQELIDCTMTIFGNNGCHGGNIESAFIYVEMFGISTEDSYSFQQQNGHCHKGVDSGVNVTNYVRVKKNEDDLRIAVGTVGPVSVAINANYLSLYGGGIFDNPNCSKALNHAVLVVGYGVTNGKEYWIIKNSWGKRWGEDGYFKLVRNKDHQCGIGNQNAYPLIE